MGAVTCERVGKRHISADPLDSSRRGNKYINKHRANLINSKVKALSLSAIRSVVLKNENRVVYFCTHGKKKKSLACFTYFEICAY